MTWTAPRTWVTGETVTAALMNTHLRDNLLETCPATVTTAGDMVYADAANSMGSRLPIGSAGSLLVSSGSAPVWRAPSVDRDYGDGSVSQDFTLTTFSVSPPGLSSSTLPTVTVTTGTTALVMLATRYVLNDTAGQSVEIAYSVSGATTIAAAAGVRSGRVESGSANDLSPATVINLETGLTAGSNTFQMWTRIVGSGTGTIQYPKIVVIPL